MRRALLIGIGKYAGIVVLVLALVVAGAVLYLQTGHGRSFVTAQIESAASSPGSSLEIGEIDGFFPVHFAVTDVAMRDGEGPWLAVDRIGVEWAPLALLAGRVDIDRIAIGRIDLPRTPAPTVVPEEEAEADEPFTWPSLPLAIDLGSLRVDEIALGAPLLGEPAQFSLAARARLGDTAAGLALVLDLARLDGPTDNIAADIAFVPATDQLDVSLSIHEPQGGLLTKGLGLSGEPDLRIDAAGSGPLSDWEGRLEATLNGNSLAEIEAGITGTGDRNLEVTAFLTPGPLLPPELERLLAGGLTLVAAAEVPAGGEAIDLTSLTLDGRAAQISLRGRIGLTTESDLAISILADDADAFADLAPGIAWDSAALDGRVVGAWPALDISASASITALDAMDRRVLETDLALTLSGDDLLQAPIAFDLILNATGIDLGQAEANALLAEGVDLAAGGTLDLAGNVLLDTLDLGAGPIALTGHAMAERWGETLTASLALRAPDLAAVEGAGALALAGSVDADLGLTMDGPAMSVDIEARADGLGTGISQLDALLGAAPRMEAAISRTADGGIDVRSFSLAARAIMAEAQGSITQDRAALSAGVEISDLGAIDPGAKGALTLTAKVDGTLAAPRLQADVTSRQIAFGAVTANDLILNVTASDLAHAPQASVSGKAQVLGQAARLRLSVATEAETSAIRVDNVALQHGPSAISGAVRILDGIADGDLKLAISSLAPYAPLVGGDLEGSVLGDVALRNSSGRQDAILDITASNVAIADALRASSIRLAGRIDDTAGSQRIDARLDAAALVTPSVQFDTLALDAEGDMAALDITLVGKGPEASLDVRAALGQEPDRLVADISALTASLKGETLALRQPMRITQSGERLEIAGLNLGYGDGGVILDGTLAPEGNRLDLRISQLSLGLVRMFDPTQQIAGTLDGSLSLDGPRSAPVAQFDIAASDIAVDQTSGVTMSASLTGDWRNERLRADSRLDFSTGGGLDLTASLGLPADPGSGFPRMNDNAALAARASGEVDLSLANRFLAGGADRIAGRMRLDLAADGTMANPRASGSAVLSEGRYDNVRYGIKLRRMEMELRGAGDRLEVVSLTARTPGRGSVSGSGNISLGGDMPVDVAVRLERAQVIDTDLAHAIVDADLRLVGTVRQELALAGTVSVPKSEIRIPDRLPASVQEIAVVEVNAPPERAAQIEAEKAPPPETVAIALDIAIDVPQQMMIRGRGLEAEMEGALKVEGTADQPIVTGEVSMRRGTLDIVGRRLAFDRGRVEFDGGEKIDPILDFLATSQVDTYKISITVGNRASFPKISLSSTPPLPEDEVLSQLLFEKSSGELTAFEALQLAQAAAELAGVDTGVGMLDAVRGATGLDHLSVDAGDGKSGPSLSAGRYVTDRVYVGVTQGSNAGSSAARVEIEVTDNIKLETELGTEDSKAGINWEWDY